MRPDEIMTLELQTRAPARTNRAQAHTHVGVAGALVSAAVTMLANAQLARAARRYKSRGDGAEKPLGLPLKRLLRTLGPGASLGRPTAFIRGPGFGPGK